MPRIDLNRFSIKDKSRYKVHDANSATYSKFEISGDKYFQIDMYGSDTRECQGQTSQTIQFNEREAKELVKLLMDYFWFSK